jgi:hypothetical protein
VKETIGKPQRATAHSDALQNARIDFDQRNPGAAISGEIDEAVASFVNETTMRVTQAHKVLARKYNVMEIGAALLRYRDAADKLVRSPFGRARIP